MRRLVRAYAGHLALWGILLLGSSAALAFPMEDDQTPGTLALGFKKRSNFWTEASLGVMDGKIKTSPPDSTTYDRRLEAGANVGGDRLLTPRLGFRLNLTAETSKRRQMGEGNLDPITDEVSGLLRPAADLTFITDKGLEVFAGIEDYAYQSSKREEKSPNGVTTTKLLPAQVMARRFGVVRRAQVWNGGFYYVAGAEGKRTLKASIFDGSTSETMETVVVPSRVGLVGEFDWLLHWNFDLAFVEANGKGPKNDNGVSAYADSFEARIGGYQALANGAGIKGSFAHKTISYADSSFITLETIPMNVLKVEYLWGTLDSNQHLGLVLGKGSDGQSLKEFNAKYDSLGYALVGGWLTSF